MTGKFLGTLSKNWWKKFVQMSKKCWKCPNLTKMMEIHCIHCTCLHDNKKYKLYTFWATWQLSFPCHYSRTSGLHLLVITKYQLSTRLNNFKLSPKLCTCRTNTNNSINNRLMLWMSILFGVKSTYKMWYWDFFIQHQSCIRANL